MTKVPMTRVALAAFVAIVAALLIATPRALAQDLPSAPVTVPPGQAALRINEYMASNLSTLADPDEPDEFPDWIEIYNPTGSTVSLTGLSLTDDVANPTKSSITQTLTISPNGYLVFYADNDPEQGVRHLGFALSANGESIGLFYTTTGEEIDSLDFGPQVGDRSEGRKPDGTGSLQPLAVPSPGRSNAFAPPSITGVSRSALIPDESAAVTVTATITDNGSIVSATLIYSTASSLDVQLPMQNGTGNQYSAVIPGFAKDTYVSYAVEATDDESNTTLTRRSGYVVGYVPPVLVINEIMAENRGLVEDLDDAGEFPDWLELHNPGSAAVSLDGLTLSDSPIDTVKYRIPDSISVAPKGFILVYLDDDAEQTNLVDKRLHANFSLSKDGESVGLYGAEGSVEIDGHTFGEQQDNVAIGRYPDGQDPFVELVCSTPGAPNQPCEVKNYLPAVRGP